MTGRWTLAVTSSTGVMGLAIGRVSDSDTAQPSNTAQSSNTAQLSGTAQPSNTAHVTDVEVFTDRRHAEEISPRLQELLDGAGVAIEQLERLVIDVGPGRFTGLRVGLATVRALGFALDLPLIGVTSLAVLAASAEVETETVTAVIDARRNEVFQQTFADGTPISDAVVGRPEDLSEVAGGVVVGDGVDRYLDIYRAAAATSGATVLTERHPRAAVMLAMSSGLVGKPGTEVQPLYLRDPDANPNIKTRPTA